MWIHADLDPWGSGSITLVLTVPRYLKISAKLVQLYSTVFRIRCSGSVRDPLNQKCLPLNYRSGYSSLLFSSVTDKMPKNQDFFLKFFD
jgi:hypothetical protein